MQIIASNLTLARESFALHLPGKITTKAGEISVITGANGSGKSTLLRALAGLHPLRSGSLRYYNARSGEVVENRAFGYLSHRSGLHPALPLTRFLSHTRSLLAGEQAGKNVREAVEDALSWCQVSSAPCVGDLSYGKGRMLGLAFQCARAQNAVFADEPFAGLDANARSLAASLLKTAAKAEMPVLITAHSAIDAEILQTRALVDLNEPGGNSSSE